MPKLPDKGQWKERHGRTTWTGPFTFLTVDFTAMTGTVQLESQTAPLSKLTITAPDKFTAAYSIGGKSGTLEAECIDYAGLPANTLRIELPYEKGTKIVCTYTPVSLQEVLTASAPKLRALAILQEFEKRTGRGVFPNISREAVARDLRWRIESPESLDQAQSSFCGPAAFMFCYLDDPVSYTKYVTELYDTGQAHIGSILVQPSSGFRFDPLPWDTRPADWIALGSLRDSENWFFEYHRDELPFLNARGDIEIVEEIRGGTSAWDMVKWFQGAGYTRVEDFTGADMNVSKTRLASEYYGKNYRVVLSIGSNMLSKKTVNSSSFAADHWVVLTSPIVSNGSEVSFTIYTWANKKWAVKVTPEEFAKNYYGFIAAAR